MLTRSGWHESVNTGTPSSKLYELNRVCVRVPLPSILVIFTVSYIPAPSFDAIGGSLPS